jgi:hypothetical protein
MILCEDNHMNDRLPSHRPHTRVSSTPLLFPVELSAPFEHSPTADESSQPADPTTQTLLLSLSQIIVAWPALLKRLGRRRRALESILQAVRPIRLIGQTLTIGFPPDRQFHRELLDLHDYRICVEKELARTFRVTLAVITSVHPQRWPLQR